MSTRSRIIAGICGLFAVAYWGYSIMKANHFSEQYFHQNVGKNGIVETIIAPPITVALDGMLGLVSEYSVQRKGEPQKLESIVDSGIVSRSDVEVHESSDSEKVVVEKVQAEEVKSDPEVVYAGVMQVLESSKGKDVDDSENDSEGVAADKQDDGAVYADAMKLLHRDDAKHDRKHRKTSVTDKIPDGAIFDHIDKICENGKIVNEVCDGEVVIVSVYREREPLTVDVCMRDIDRYLMTLQERRFVYKADSCNADLVSDFFKGAGYTDDVLGNHIKDCHRILCSRNYYDITKQDGNVIICKNTK